ncbi:MAG: nitroreductase family protein [Oscillospiraceae bacterium]|nr:nitroreductase family protein [Oscillospiraceae bacterium]
MVLDIIKDRRSIRRYTDREVTEEQIREILDAAFWAPTAVNRQEWRFVVVRNRAILEKLAEINPNARMTAGCAFSVIVCYEEGVNDRFAQVDCGAAIQNMLLQAHSMGIGSVWCALMPDSDREALYRDAVGFPACYRTVASVQFGYPDEVREAEDRFDEAKVIFVD